MNENELLSHAMGPSVAYLNGRGGVIYLDHDQAEQRLLEMSKRDAAMALALARLAVARLEQVVVG